MVAIIQESQVIADLIPLIHYYVSADVELTDELPVCMDRFLSRLIMTAFHRTTDLDDDIDPDWLRQLRHCQVLVQLLVVEWAEVHVLDTDGTFIIFTRVT